MSPTPDNNTIPLAGASNNLNSKAGSQCVAALPYGFLVKSPSGTVYRIVSVLGHGGFGITYLAETSIKIGNIAAKAKVALKEHFMETACERDTSTGKVTCSTPVRNQVESSRRDFIAEAHRLQEIGAVHPNIVAVNEVFQANDTAYYVMEFLEGPTLRGYVKDRGELSPEQTQKLMLPIVKAVAYLHRSNMTHLDIKPDNIIIATDEAGHLRPVLIDFGLSKHYDKEGSPTSAINSLGCSDGYAPVEQYAGIMEFSPTADVYSLGATMLFCLTGHDPARSTDLHSPEDEAASQHNTPLYPALIASLRHSRQERPANADALARLMQASKPKTATTSTSNTAILSTPDKPQPAANATEIISSPAASEKGSTTQKSPIKGWIILMIVTAITAIVIALFFVTRQPGKAVKDEPVTTQTTTKPIAPSQPQGAPEVQEIHQDAPQPAVPANPEPKATPQPSRPTPSASNMSIQRADDPATRLDKDFANASTIPQFKALADAGYAKAFAPLAELYLNAENYKAAARYAKKAKRKGVDTARAQRVIDRLDQLHYYDDPTTGGKP